MNWSTRLRRWVRIRMPPVREASMKPTAATVLPAPVACSNQNRRLAPGSSGASATTSASSVSGSSQSWGLLVGVEHVLVVELGGRGAVAVRVASAGRLAVRAARRCAPLRRASPLRALELGDDRGERPGERVDLVLVELGAVEQLRRLLVEQPLEPEQQRVVAPPLEARRLGARRRARRGRRRRRAAGRCPGARSAIVSPASRIGSRVNSRTRSRSASLSSLSRARGYVGGISHGKGSSVPRSPLIQDGGGERSKLGRGGRRAEIPSGRTDVPPRSKNYGTRA